MHVVKKKKKQPPAHTHVDTTCILTHIHTTSPKQKKIAVRRARITEHPITAPASAAMSDSISGAEGVQAAILFPYPSPSRTRLLPALPPSGSHTSAGAPTPSHPHPHPRRPLRRSTPPSEPLRSQTRCGAAALRRRRSGHTVRSYLHSYLHSYSYSCSCYRLHPCSHHLRVRVGGIAGRARWRGRVREFEAG